jgi:hypothetical protein
MKQVVLLALAMVVFVTGALAAPKKGKSGEPYHKIFQVNSLSITLSYGHTGEAHQTFQIDKETRITLEGVPVPARELQAGMVAWIKVGPGKRLLAIHAKGAPRHPSKSRVG